MDMNTLIIISCVCMMFVIGRIFIVPIKWIFKLVFNSVLGGILIWIINMIGGVWGFHIGLNIYTSVLVRNIRNSWRNCFDFVEIDCWINKISSIDMEPIADGKLLKAIFCDDEGNCVTCKVRKQYEMFFVFQLVRKNCVHDILGIAESFSE